MKWTALSVVYDVNKLFEKCLLLSAGEQLYNYTFYYTMKKYFTHTSVAGTK